ncbi:imidazoleglycerol-phosphate dehydratase HisB [Bacillota bacterium LX-D]|nr:imidazoleglycerol-phosphate dehydratase HisB [Bacillota bacterium LX-D]
MARIGQIARKTGETEIQIKINLDGSGEFLGTSGIPFFDHMLKLWAKHGSFDVELQAQGDLDVDGHHTVEDIGIVLGQAFQQALGTKENIYRYGQMILPMDETLILAAVDISGRPYLNFDIDIPLFKLGQFDTELVEEFMRAFCLNSGLTLHLKKFYGQNTHHLIEAIFKALARALRQAVGVDPKGKGIPSTKGLL